jgi:hypothetical protein
MALGKILHMLFTHNPMSIDRTIVRGLVVHKLLASLNESAGACSVESQAIAGSARTIPGKSRGRCRDRSHLCEPP